MTEVNILDRSLYNLLASESAFLQSKLNLPASVEEVNKYIDANPNMMAFTRGKSGEILLIRHSPYLRQATQMRIELKRNNIIYHDDIDIVTDIPSFIDYHKDMNIIYLLPDKYIITPVRNLLSKKAYIFDFDLTLAKIHLYSKSRQDPTIVQRPKEVFRDIVLANFARFVDKQKMLGNLVVILSFSSDILIRNAFYYLDPNLSVQIVTPETFGISSHNASKIRNEYNMKAEYIKFLVNMCQKTDDNILDFKDVIFYDDDPENINKVSETGAQARLVSVDKDLAELEF